MTPDCVAVNKVMLLICTDKVQTKQRLLFSDINQAYLHLFVLQFVHHTRRMYALEKHAISVYTKNCFQLFSEEVDKATQYDVAEGSQENTFTVTHNNAETRQQWARVVFNVTVDENGKKYSCECGNYEHFGMLCCHAIKVIHTKILDTIVIHHQLMKCAIEL